MNNKLALLFFVAVSMLLWNSCSVTKRYHNRGFYIDFGFKNKAIENPKTVISNIKADSVTYAPILESVDKTPTDVYTQRDVATENSIFIEVQKNDLEVTVPDTGINEGNRTTEEEIAAKKKESNKKSGPVASIAFAILGLLTLLIGIASSNRIAVAFGYIIIEISIFFFILAVIALFIWSYNKIARKSEKTVKKEINKKSGPVASIAFAVLGLLTLLIGKGAVYASRTRIAVAIGYIIIEFSIFFFILAAIALLIWLYNKKVRKSEKTVQSNDFERM